MLRTKNQSNAPNPPSVTLGGGRRRFVAPPVVQVLSSSDSLLQSHATSTSTDYLVHIHGFVGPSGSWQNCHSISVTRTFNTAASENFGIRFSIEEPPMLVADHDPPIDIPDSNIFPYHENLTFTSMTNPNTPTTLSDNILLSLLDFKLSMRFVTDVMNHGYVTSLHEISLDFDTYMAYEELTGSSPPSMLAPPKVNLGFWFARVFEHVVRSVHPLILGTPDMLYIVPPNTITPRNVCVFLLRTTPHVAPTKHPQSDVHEEIHKVDGRLDSNLVEILSYLYSVAISLDGVRDKNVMLLKKLNTAIFPVRYNEKYYADALASGEFKKLDLPPFLPPNFSAYYSDICVGLIACQMEKKEGGAICVYIMTLGVLAPYRGIGIGIKLLNHVLELCLKQHISKI
ncbi:Detected protein of confused Function [Hibiscus syriacus]|uniref:Detected protein of confused Function n=1 Tax=Hibiscus syriacus TaxID=106335 RepID=A0A6A2XBI9_HIBSY|nr:Detected protein of confused Function [Hibiscus syriacus]